MNFEILESFVWKHWDMGLTWSWGIKIVQNQKSMFSDGITHSHILDMNVSGYSSIHPSIIEGMACCILTGFSEYNCTIDSIYLLFSFSGNLFNTSYTYIQDMPKRFCWVEIVSFQRKIIIEVFLWLNSFQTSKVTSFITKLFVSRYAYWRDRLSRRTRIWGSIIHIDSCFWLKALSFG